MTGRDVGYRVPCQYEQVRSLSSRMALILQACRGTTRFAWFPPSTETFLIFSCLTHSNLSVSCDHQYPSHRPVAFTLSNCLAASRTRSVSLVMMCKSFNVSSMNPRYSMNLYLQRCPTTEFSFDDYHTVKMISPNSPHRG